MPRTYVLRIFLNDGSHRFGDDDWRGASGSAASADA